MKSARFLLLLFVLNFITFIAAEADAEPDAEAQEQDVQVQQLKIQTGGKPVDVLQEMKEGCDDCEEDGMDSNGGY